MSWGNKPSSHKTWAHKVLTRDHYQCTRCGYQGTPGKQDVQADHIINRARGGDYTLTNGQTLCIPCHDAKTKLERAAGTKSRQRDPEPHPGRLATAHPRGEAP